MLTNRPGRSVIVVDDYPEVLIAIDGLLRGHGFNTKSYGAGEALLADPLPTNACCLLIDLSMPGMDGIDLLTRLRRAGCTVPALIVSGVGNIRLAVRAMQAGALDFVEKPFVPEQLIAAVRACEARYQQPKPQTVAPWRDKLTNREREVMEEVLVGLSSKEIASKFGISHRTVDIHRSNLMNKAGASNLASLVRMVYDAARSPKS